MRQLSFAIENTNPRNLLPRKFHPRFLGQQGKEKVHCWSKSRIKLELYWRKTALARLQIKICTELSLQNYGDTLEKHAALHQVLWDPEHSQLIETLVPRHPLSSKYSNLKPFVQVSDFLLHWLVRRQGLGSRWYQEIFEPFLINSGVKTVVVQGSCVSPEAFGDFWYQAGYGGNLVYNYDNKREIIYTLVYKILNQKQGPFRGPLLSNNIQHE